MAHNKHKQSTGSYKGNRDKHEGRQHNSAKKGGAWVDHGKHTNSERNRERSRDKGGWFDRIFGLDD